MERRGERRSDGQINDMTILTSTRQLLYLGGERTGTGTEEAVSPFSYRGSALYHLHLHPYPHPHRIPINNGNLDQSHLLFIMNPPASLILCASSSLEGLWSCDMGTGLKFLQDVEIDRRHVG